MDMLKKFNKELKMRNNKNKVNNLIITLHKIHQGALRIIYSCPPIVSGISFFLNHLLYIFYLLFLLSN